MTNIVPNNAKYPAPYSSGIRMHSGDSLNTNFQSPIYSYEDGITAFATGGQTNARPLYAGQTNVTTVATANDSVMLPPAVGGLRVFIRNSAGSNFMQVFGAGIDTINGVATATGVAQAAGLSAVYFCTLGSTPATAGKWFRVLSA